MLGLSTMFSDAFSKVESAISGLIGSTNEEFPQITNTGGLARTDFDASTWDKFRPGDKTFTLDAGSFIFPGTFPANGFKNRKAPTWAGRLYAAVWGGDRFREFSDLFRHKKVSDTVYYPDYTYDKTGLKDTTYRRLLQKGESYMEAISKLRKTADSTKRAKW
jgi:hypothetical protein